jgi:primosomal protein N' (replication factor Y)
MPGRFADVILPLSLPRQYTYSVPEEMAGRVQPGMRVVVQLGRQKMYAGLVYRLHDIAPAAAVKPLTSLLDAAPVVNDTQLRLWEWMASYYLCSLGDVMHVAMPAALKLQSETRIVLNDAYDHRHETLTDDEYLLYEALLGRTHLTPGEAAAILHRKSAHRVLQGLIAKGVVVMEEELRERYRPKTVSVLRLQEKLAADDEALKAVFDSLEKRSPRQLEALMAMLHAAPGPERGTWVERSELLKGDAVSTAALSALVKKGVLEEESRTKERHVSEGGDGQDLAVLSAVQAGALEEIRRAFDTHPAVLLHGVTASGKTEVYLHLIREMLEQGKQVVYLLPEIALTLQVIRRLKKVLGDCVDVYHSRFSLNERVEVWQRVLSGDSRSQVIVGARSALFLPYSRLGLVIVDEEHDSSFKQADPAPRYHGRDTALVLAGLHGARTLLGTATPSLESYDNALQGKYGLVTMQERYSGMPLPSIDIVDIAAAAKRKEMQSHYSKTLLEAIASTLQQGDQVILFQNRRGFAPVVECRQCGWTPHCRNCSVSMTVHQQVQLLRCHYCGYSEPLPAACEDCGSHQLALHGMGTEKVVEEMQVFFPEAVIERLDLDAARSRLAYQRILTDFEERKIQILVGTQMITKGLDFDTVGLVGILQADLLLNFPDFRAHERSYQLLQQVSGRSGRKYRQGRVMIQTRQPGHWVLEYVLTHDYPAFFAREKAERERFLYPPHSRLIELHLKHRDDRVVGEAAEKLAVLLRARFGQRVYGPLEPLVRRVRNYWLKNILIKLEKEASPAKAKTAIREVLDQFYADPAFRSVLVQPDVDPQ